MFKSTFSAVGKLTVSTVIGYVLLITSMYLFPGFTRGVIRVGDHVADAIRYSSLMSDNVGVIADMILDGRVFAVVPFLFLARFLIEVFVQGTARVRWTHAGSAAMTAAIFIGIAYVVIA